MRRIIDALKDLGEKVTGKTIEVTDENLMLYGEDLTEILDEITANYEAGGGSSTFQVYELLEADFRNGGDVENETDQATISEAIDNFLENGVLPIFRKADSTENMNVIGVRAVDDTGVGGTKFIMTAPTSNGKSAYITTSYIGITSLKPTTYSISGEVIDWTDTTAQPVEDWDVADTLGLLAENYKVENGDIILIEDIGNGYSSKIGNVEYIYGNYATFMGTIFHLEKLYTIKLEQLNVSQWQITVKEIS